MRTRLALAGGAYAVLAVATAVAWSSEDPLSSDPLPAIALYAAVIAGLTALGLTVSTIVRSGGGRAPASPTGVRHLGALRVLALLAVVIAGPLALAVLLGFAAGLEPGQFEHGW